MSKFQIGDRVVCVRNTPAVQEGWVGYVKELGMLVRPLDYTVESEDGNGTFAFYECELELLEHAKKECSVEEGDICLVDEYLEAMGHKEICILSVDKNKGRMQFCKWPMEEHWQHNVYQASVNDIAMVLFNRFESVGLGKGKEMEVPKEQSALDKQVSGDHYKGCSIQPIEYIHANGLDYFEGNAVKYITRHRKKNGKADIEKAIHYLELLLELEYKNESE